MKKPASFLDSNRLNADGSSRAILAEQDLSAVQKSLFEGKKLLQVPNVAGSEARLDGESALSEEETKLNALALTVGEGMAGLKIGKAEGVDSSPDSRPAGGHLTEMKTLGRGDISSSSFNEQDLSLKQQSHSANMNLISY